MTLFYSKKALIVPSNRKPPPSITVIGNPPDANRHEYHGGRYAQNFCKGKRHPDGMPSDKKNKIIQVSDVAYFYCPAEIKEIKEIFLPARCEALSAISALSAGLLVSHAESFLSHGNKRNKGNLVTLTLRTPFCPFCSFCGTLLSHAESFYCPIFIVPRK